MHEAPEAGAPTVDPRLGQVVDGRYRIEQKIGEGGMGVVYLASHTVLQKKLALKVLRAESSRDTDVVQRFMQEAQAATSIGHANIIDISDFGRLADGSVYFVMEHLDGISLADMIKRGGSLAVDEALHLVRQIGSALEAAHARGIVHRDLKPDNIFVVRRGNDARFVKVLDFGVAKVGGASSKLTKTGMVFGTPHYMSPEQAAGHSVDQRTDVYAVGVIMYEMFAGQVPFDADTFMGILSKHMFEPPPRPTDVCGDSIGPLEAVILRALEKNLDQRYQSMTELLADLDTIAAGGTVADRPPRRPSSELAVAFQAPRTPEPRTRSKALFALAVLVLAVVGVGVAAAVFLLTGDPEGEALVQAAPEPPEPTVEPPRAEAPPADAPEPEETPPPELEPEPVRVTITSEPSGAEVLLDGVMVGNTPVRLPRPTTGTQTMTLRMRGHEDMEVQISPRSGETLAVTLERRVVRAPRRPVRRPPAEPTSPPAPEPPVVHEPRRTSEVVDPWAY